jgi:hypothetical protein
VEKQPSHSEGGQGGRARRHNYERGFIWSERLFRAREILLSQGPVGKHFFLTRPDDREKALKNQTHPWPKTVGLLDSIRGAGARGTRTPFLTPHAAAFTS